MGVSNLFRLTQKVSFDELIPIRVDELIPIGVDELIPMDVSDLFSRPPKNTKLGTKKKLPNKISRAISRGICKDDQGLDERSLPKDDNEYRFRMSWTFREERSSLG
jgi:hypothetical protein